ncbi:uncharacterized protein FOMMEDRAFT_148622 [Fomitiporia mediterranea MF3/22]|uniref:uncharacterized protein n=1 Tax=Fomitiporia mediterranea (strain MF3/22) TaxID=694068 RepID=UPI000440914B|nr:uncharacterized protein FOMMEDRAFT_148622 [Fomitiporia mediterranea MF3/22]EJC99804.1 hypothetical protein FOMMEDRAFT_148622 [Fomitiporia mediterranea MF3/22]
MLHYSAAFYIRILLTPFNLTPPLLSCFINWWYHPPQTLHESIHSYRTIDVWKTSNIVFLVEDCLFTVNRKPFETESDVFSGMFSLPVGSDVPVDGSDEKHPLRLEQVTIDEFQALLTVMYTPLYRQAGLQLSEKEWLHVLKLAHRWSFIEIKDLAAEELSKFNLDGIESLKLSQQYEIDTWVEPAVATLAKRAAPLTTDEVNQIGFEYALDACTWGHTIKGTCRVAMTGRSHNMCGERIVPVSETCPFCKASREGL